MKVVKSTSLFFSLVLSSNNNAIMHFLLSFESSAVMLELSSDSKLLIALGRLSLLLESRRASF